VGTPQLKLVRLSGSADVTLLHYQGPHLRLEVTGSGDIRVEGTCGELEIHVSGSGDVQASKLVAKSVKAALSGSGDVHVQASDALDVDLSGSGDVHYTGNP